MPPKKKPEVKNEPNIVTRFFLAIGNGIKWIIWAILEFIKSLILAILEIIRDVVLTVAKFLYHVRNSIFWVWILLLSTLITAVACLWLLTAAIKNLDESSIGSKYFSKMEFLLDLHAESVKKEIMKAEKLEEN